MGKRSFVSDFVDLYAANGGVRSVIDTTDWVVDNLSYALGQQFVLTGDIVIRKREIDGRMCVYLVLTTKCGRELSLMALMGVSSLKGYDLENILEDLEYKDFGDSVRVSNDDNGYVITKVDELIY